MPVVALCAQLRQLLPEPSDEGDRGRLSRGHRQTDGSIRAEGVGAGDISADRVAIASISTPYLFPRRCDFLTKMSVSSEGENGIIRKVERLKG